MKLLEVLHAADLSSLYFFLKKHSGTFYSIERASHCCGLKVPNKVILFLSSGGSESIENQLKLRSRYRE